MPKLDGGGADLRKAPHTRKVYYSGLQAATYTTIIGTTPADILANTTATITVPPGMTVNRATLIFTINVGNNAGGEMIVDDGDILFEKANPATTVVYAFSAINPFRLTPLGNPSLKLVFDVTAAVVAGGTGTYSAAFTEVDVSAGNTSRWTILDCYVELELITSD